MNGEETRPTRALTGRETGKADLGVKRCAQLMADGLWKSRESTELVASEFGVSERTVESWATTASRGLRLAMNEGEDLRTRLALMLERHERVAMTKKGVSATGTEYNNPDVKAATNAVKTMAELMGLMVQKHEHSHAAAQYEAMPVTDKSQWLRAKAAQLLEEADRLDGVVHVQVDADDDD